MFTLNGITIKNFVTAPASDGYMLRAEFFVGKNKVATFFDHGNGGEPDFDFELGASKEDRELLQESLDRFEGAVLKSKYSLGVCDAGLFAILFDTLRKVEMWWGRNRKNGGALCAVASITSGEATMQVYSDIEAAEKAVASRKSQFLAKYTENDEAGLIYCIRDAQDKSNYNYSVGTLSDAKSVREKREMKAAIAEVKALENAAQAEQAKNDLECRIKDRYTVVRSPSRYVVTIMANATGKTLDVPLYASHDVLVALDALT